MHKTRPALNRLQYKRLVCNLLGIYEDADFPRDIINNADDYVWYRVRFDATATQYSPPRS